MLRILYQDEQVVAVDKPAGILTVPGRNDASVALSAQVQARFPGALPVHLLDRDYLTKISGIRDDQKEQAIVNAIRALVMLKEKSVESKLKSLSKGDPSLKVRQAALEALEQFKKIQDLTSSRLIIQ